MLVRSSCLELRLQLRVALQLGAGPQLLQLRLQPGNVGTQATDSIRACVTLGNQHAGLSMHATTSAWPACMARSSGVAPPSDRNSSIVATAYLECATATREALRHFCNAGGSRFTGGRGAAGRGKGLCMAAQLPACKCLCTGCCQLLQLKLLLTSTIFVDLGAHEALLKYKLQNMRVCLKGIRVSICEDGDYHGMTFK